MSQRSKLFSRVAITTLVMGTLTALFEAPLFGSRNDKAKNKGKI